ncbi:MAG: SRPBCC domain-containing protein [Ignavibacteriales bacterium]|nr:SRPBCC domain-containing protein [Ignavibacteriales bacterium]
MPDILHDFPINASVEQVFQAVSSPEGLDKWWTKHSSGRPMEGAEYTLWFGPEYDWRAVVSKFVPLREFELSITHADRDWQNTRVGFSLKEKNAVTQALFHHLGWPELNEHYRISCFCWAMYLRLLKRYVEFSEVIPYEKRLDV